MTYSEPFPFLPQPQNNGLGLPPELARYMQQQQFRSMLANASRGMLQAAQSGMGLGPGLLMGLASAGQGDSEFSPLKMLETRNRLAEIQNRQEELKQGREQQFAQQALTAGDRYDPRTQVLWNQPPRPDAVPPATNPGQREQLLAKAYPAAYGKAKIAEQFPEPPDYNAPVTVMGSDGKPTLIRFPRKGGGAPIPVKGYSPLDETPSGRYGTVQVDEAGRKYQLGPRGKRHYLPGQGSEPMPSVSRDFVLPILQKVQSGQPLTQHEQTAWDLYSRTGLIDQMLRGMQGGGYLPPTANQPMSSVAPAAQGSGNESQLLSQAREAVAAGESRAAVEAELRAMGLDPAKL